MSTPKVDPLMPHYVLDARTATPHFPGIGRYVKNLLRGLIRWLASNEWLTVLYHPAHPLKPVQSTSARFLPMTASPFSLRQQWSVPRMLRDLDADLYHSAYYLMPYHPGVPTLLTIYDLIPLLFPQYSTIRARILFRWASASALATAEQSIAISDATRRDIMQHFAIGTDKITTIPLAADPKFRPQSPEALDEVCHRYNLPDDFMLYVGSNKPHKNLTRLIEAYTRLIEPSAAPTLAIAGAWDPRYPEPRQRAEALGLGGRVHWLGPIPEEDLPSLYAAAMLFVFPSLYEGFGLPPLEAMACGTPVVCSNTSSLPEVVGSAAVLFDPTQPASIAEALRKLITNPDLRHKMRRRGLEQVSQFSWTATAQATLSLYRQLATNSR